VSAAEVIHELQSCGVELSLVGGKLKIRGEESVVASILPVVRANRDAIMSQLAGASAPSDPWAWLPNDCPDGVDWNAWDCARILCDVCRRESFSLCRRDSGFILIPTKPMAPESAEVLSECVDYLLDESIPYLAGYADHFPVLTLAAASECLYMLVEHHGHEGFKVRGWYGLEFPESWPVAARVAVQSIYIERLILDVGHEGPLH
jgi:hypothetical protein